MALDGGASVEVVEEATGEPHSDSMDVLHGIGCWFVGLFLLSLLLKLQLVEGVVFTYVPPL